MSRTAFSKRFPDNAQYLRKTLAQRLYLPQLRQPEGLGTCRQALHLRMRRLRPTNFRDRQNRLPSQPPAASHLVPSIFAPRPSSPYSPCTTRQFLGREHRRRRSGAVEKGATIVSDGFASYRNNRQGYIVGTMAARVVLPGITAHGVFVNFKQRTLGSYHGVQKPHLQRYLDEFVFRWNRRRHVASSLEALFESPPPFLTLDIGPSWIT